MIQHSSHSSGSGSFRVPAMELYESGNVAIEERVQYNPHLLLFENRFSLKRGQRWSTQGMVEIERASTVDGETTKDRASGSYTYSAAVGKQESVRMPDGTPVKCFVVETHDRVESRLSTDIFDDTSYMAPGVGFAKVKERQVIKDRIEKYSVWSSDLTVDMTLVSFSRALQSKRFSPKPVPNIFVLTIKDESGSVVPFPKEAAVDLAKAIHSAVRAGVARVF